VALAILALAAPTAAFAATPAAPPAPSVAAPPASIAAARTTVLRLIAKMNTTAWVSARTPQGIDPSLQRLEDDNSHLADGVDLMDADPVCQCQDSGGHYHLVSLTPAGADMANARIAQDGSDPYTLVYHRVGAKWLIYNILDDDGDFRAALTKHNACMRAHHDDDSIQRCFDGH
jgi:hypothetical protein